MNKIVKRGNFINLVKELIKIKEEAKILGIFTDDRELLECPSCGLMEDVDVNGRLFTVFKNEPYKDTGLNFKEVGNKGDRFSCSNCSQVITINE